MSSHLTEEEQVEALKQWWKDNAVSVIGGALIGLAAVFGWRWWGDYQTGLADQASQQYQTLKQAIQAKSPEAAQMGDKLLTEQRTSVYAVFAALDLAKQRVESGDLPAAKARLEWAMNNAVSAEIRQLARLRLTRVLVELNDLDAASKLIAEAGQDDFAGNYAELRGDIARARKDLPAARQAYQEALIHKAGQSSLVQMKLDDLGGSDA